MTVFDAGCAEDFLLDRAPFEELCAIERPRQGRTRFLPVSRQSNLQVVSAKSARVRAVMDQLREEAFRQGKPFGLFFDNIEGGFTTTGRGSANAFNVLPNVVYRIYTDRRREPELVRGVDLIGTPLAAFGKIIATDDTIDVFNGVCGAESAACRSRSYPSLRAAKSGEKKSIAGNAPDLPAQPVPGQRATR